MAKSKYAYVKDFEDNNSLLPHTWVVIRIDGHAFTRFSDVHGFQKPNDEPALQLMNECAKGVLQAMPDLVFAYGESDEYSFVLKKSSTLYKRRSSKLVSLVVSLFSATYVLKWPTFFPEKPLQYAPSFDGRAIGCNSWRQVDCHINNQYNTYWLLVQGTEDDQGDSSFKNDLLFNEFGVNYSNLPLIFRKGSMVYRKVVDAFTSNDGETYKTTLVVEHNDISKRMESPLPKKNEPCIPGLSLSRNKCRIGGLSPRLRLSRMDSRLCKTNFASQASG